MDYRAVRPRAIFQPTHRAILAIPRLAADPICRISRPPGIPMRAVPVSRYLRALIYDRDTNFWRQRVVARENVLTHRKLSRARPRGVYGRRVSASTREEPPFRAVKANRSAAQLLHCVLALACLSIVSVPRARSLALVNSRRRRLSRATLARVYTGSAARRVGRPRSFSESSTRTPRARPS